MIKSPNIIWIIVLLFIIIIALIAFIITDRIIRSEDLMEYISVCSILISITLSIFAIQYTYTSNLEVQRPFEKINSVADAIRSTSENLTVTSNILNDNLGKILEHLDNISNSQKDLPKLIAENINNALPNVKDQPSNLPQRPITQKG